MIEAQQPQAPQPTPYVPESIDPLIFEDFEEINTATLRPGVDDKQAAWLDGFMPLGPRRNLRTMYGIGPYVPVASPGSSIAQFAFININTTEYCIAVTSSGAVFAVNTTTSFVLEIAAPGTILNPSQQTVGICQYGARYVLIVAQQPNGYFIWDGATFFVPGAPGPTGTMPLAISGSCIEVYAGRVWIGNNATITFSAPGSVVDFSSGSGGGNFTSSDSFLRVAFIGLKQTNGFLYMIADSSVNYISGVQTSGSPPVTTFTNQNSDPQVGSSWPNTIGVFNRNILFGNPFGAQVSYGGAVTKISEALDGVWNTVPNFGNALPSAAQAIIFGKKCWIILIPIIDPVNGQQVNKLLLWNGKQWWATTQDLALTIIAGQEINSVLTAWGTDGTGIFKLFNQPSIAITKVAQTKLWDKPGGYQLTKFVTRLWGLLLYYSALSTTLDVSIDNEIGSVNTVAPVTSLVITWLTAGGLAAIWQTASSGPATWIGSATGYSVISPDAVGQSGVLIGFTVTTNAADMAIISMMIQPTIAGYRG